MPGNRGTWDNGMYNVKHLHDKFMYWRSFPTDCQLGGKLIEGMGHAGQATASAPGGVPSIPEWS